MALTITLSACSTSIETVGSRSGENPDASETEGATPLTSETSPEEASSSSFGVTEQNNPYVVPRDASGAFQMKLGGESMTVYPHPRVWLTPASLEELKTRAVATNPMWVGVNDAVTKGINSGSYNTAADSGTLINYSLAYLVTGQTNYLTAAKKVLFNFTDPARYSIACDGTTYCGNDNLDYGSIELMSISAAFDWLYPYLSNPERQAFMNWVYGQFIPFLRKHPFYGDSVHNLGHTKWCGEFLWALATLGDDARAEALANQTYMFWRDDILPILDEALPGGHTYSGSGYGYNRVFKYQLYAFEAALTSFGLNMYQSHPWPIDEAYYRAHSMLPGDQYFLADWESAEAYDLQGRMTENEAILAQRFKNSTGGKIAQYYVENVYRPRAFYNQGGTRINPIYVGRWFLWYDPSLEEENYTQTKPTAYVADGLGTFISREEWNNPSSTWVNLSASKYIGDHQLHNEGSFKIFKEEYLVVENGRFYTGQASNLTPTDTNILFMGDGKVQYGEVTGGIYRRSSGSMAQMDRFMVNDVARISYSRADLTTAYVPAYFPLDYFHRNMVHLKSMGNSSMDYIVLFDRVKSVNAAAKKTFTHLVKPPSISGNVASMNSPGNVSKLFVQNLLPESTSMTTEAVADKTSGGFPQESSDQPTRLVLTKTDGATRESMFLSVYAMTDSVGENPPNISRVESNDSKAVGAFIQDPGVSRVVMFSKNNQIFSAGFSYVYTKSNSVQNTVFDLMPEGKYDVVISGTTSVRTVSIAPSGSGAYQADSQGSLIFSDL